MMNDKATESLDHLAILRGMWRRHKLLMAILFLVIAAPFLTMVYLTSHPMYESTATIAIESSPVEQIPFFRDLPRRDNIAAHLILLKSRSLSEGVVEALPKESFEELLSNSQYRDYMLALTNLIKGWMGKPPTVLSPQQRAVGELQNARAQFIQVPQATGVVNIKGTASSPRVAMDIVNTHIQVLLSRTRNANQEEARKAREFLEQQTQQVKESLTQAEQTVTRFEQQKGRIRLGAQTELDLVRLSQTENALAEAQASREVLSARIASLRQSLAQATVREVKVPVEENAKGQTTPASSSSDVTASFNAFKTAQERLARLEAKLAALRERYTEAHPLVKATQDEVANEQARVTQLARDLPATPPPTEPRPQRPALAPAVVVPASDRADAYRQLASLETEEASLQARVETLKIQVDRLRKNLRNLSQEEVEFSSLRRTVEANRNLLTVLSDKLMTSRIREQGETTVVRIIDPASYPLQPTQSKIQKLILMVLALASGLAFGAAFGLEYLRQPVETESDIQKAIGLMTLGSVGTIGGSADGKASHQKRKHPLLPIHLPSSSVPTGVPMELYRAVRASVETERLKSPFQSILVTSPGPSEGKSTTALNLAHVFQEFGRRVLVVEADLRRPSFSRALALKSNPSLLDFLSGAATFEQVCRVLPSGVTVILGQTTKDDAAALLASPRTKELLAIADAQFDVILIDSPPILAVPDNLLLIPAVDRVILVARASVTSKRDLRKAQRVLEQANARTLGVVLNQANPRDVHYYHPRYRKYYKSGDRTTAPETPKRSRLLPWGGKK